MEALTLLLDYDGTLVPIVSRPEDAAPDEELLDLLRELAAGADVHVVSGRTRDVLDAWLGALPISLHAEHGAFSRAKGAAWQPRFSIDASWLGEAGRAMKSRALTGASIEQKTTSIAWHYRNADPKAAQVALAELRAELAPLAAAHRLNLLDGACVLELRDSRANKGDVARAIAASAPAGASIVAFGDDTTDEDMFAALPNALTIKVGDGPTVARERVANSYDVRLRLSELARHLKQRR
ncbi:MAG TPA: trehalose-phosphatase [Polyangiaceae bacterium]